MNVSCRFCERSAAIAVVPFSRPRAPCRETYCQVAVTHFLVVKPNSTRTPPLQATSADGASTSWGQEPPRLGQAGPSGPLGVAVKFRAQRGCNRPRRPIADRTLVDANDRHDDLAGRGQERLAGAIGFLDRERSLLQLQPLGTDDLDQHRSRDAAQNAVIRRPGHDLAALCDDPRIAG